MAPSPFCCGSCVLCYVVHCRFDLEPDVFDAEMELCAMDWRWCFGRGYCWSDSLLLSLEVSRARGKLIYPAIQQAFAADGATASSQATFFSSARMLSARRSRAQR